LYLTPEAISILPRYAKAELHSEASRKEHLECKDACHQIDRCTRALLFKHLAELCVELHAPCDVKRLPSKGAPRERAHHRSAPENTYGIAIFYFPPVIVLVPSFHSQILDSRLSPRSAPNCEASHRQTFAAGPLGFPNFRPAPPFPVQHHDPTDSKAAIIP